MDAVLGVAVTGTTARLALVGADGARSVIDRSEVALPGDAAEHLTETIAGTHQGLAAGGHRLVATQVCSSDGAMTAQLQQLLANAGVGGVSVVSEATAATALVRSLPQSEAGHGSALLLVDDDAATLSIVGADEVTTTVVAAEPIAGSDAVPACRALLERLGEEPGSADDIYLVGSTDEITAYADALRAESPVPLDVVANPAFALAEGAAYAAPTLASLDSVMTVAAPQLGPQLAYSEAADSGPLPFEAGNYSDVPMQSAMAPLSATAYDDLEESEESFAPQGRPRMLLVGSSLAGLVVVGFAALAVTVAIGIRPTAAVAPVPNEAQYVNPPQDKFLPYVPQQEIIPGPTGPVPVEKVVEPVQGTSRARTVWVPSTRSAPGVDVPRGSNITIDGPQVGIPPVDNGIQGPPPPGFQMPNIPLPQINLPDTINIPIFTPGQGGRGPFGTNPITGDDPRGSVDTGRLGEGTPCPKTPCSTLVGPGDSKDITDAIKDPSQNGLTDGIDNSKPIDEPKPIVEQPKPIGQPKPIEQPKPIVEQAPVEQAPVVQQAPPVVEAPAPVVEAPAPVAPAAPAGPKIPFLPSFGGGGGGSSSSSGSSDSGSSSSSGSSDSGSSSGSSSGSGGGGLIPFLPSP